MNQLLGGRTECAPGQIRKQGAVGAGQNIKAEVAVVGDLVFAAQPAPFVFIGQLRRVLTAQVLHQQAAQLQSGLLNGGIGAAVVWCLIGIEAAVRVNITA